MRLSGTYDSGREEAKNIGPGQTYSRYESNDCGFG